MAHNISNIDKQQGTSQAWHGLTEVLSKINLRESWLAKWNIVKAAMKDPSGEESEYCRIVCTDNPKIMIGKPVHCSTYTAIDNAEFLQIVQDSIDIIPGAVVESVGSVCERGRIFVGVSVPQVRELEAAGRKILPFLNFLSSHDMSAPFLVNMGTICPVCDNTFRMNLHDSANRTFRARVPHTKNAKKALENIPQLVDAYCGTAAKFAAIMDSLTVKEVSTKQADSFFAGFLAVKDESEGKRILSTRAEVEISTRAENQRNRLVDLFLSGKGNNGRDRSDLFGSVTDYYSHESAGGRDVQKQIESSEFGSGQTQKERAFDLLQDDARFAQTVAVGEYLLASN